MTPAKIIIGPLPDEISVSVFKDGTLQIQASKIPEEYKDDKDGVWVKVGSGSSDTCVPKRKADNKTPK